MARPKQMEPSVWDKRVTELLNLWCKGRTTIATVNSFIPMLAHETGDLSGYLESYEA